MFIKLNFFKIIITIIIAKLINSLSSTCLPTSKCNGVINCSENGHCYYDLYKVFGKKNDTQIISCLCDRGYTDDPKNPDTKCCYKQKSQFIGFLLEALIGFGAGHFYIGNNNIALIKMIFSITSFCSCYLIGFCFCYKVNRHNEDASSKQIILNIIFLSTIVLYLLWQLVDVVLFGINYYKDVNGVDLESW